MNFWHRLTGGTPAQHAARAVEDDKPIIRLPSREALPDASDDQAIGLISVYRALQLLTTSAGQLPLRLERGGETITDGSKLPRLVKKPDPEMDRSDWIEQAVLSLALNGNLFLRKVTDRNGSIIAARILPPAEVTVTKDPKTRVIRYHYRGEKFTTADVYHQTLMRLPGRDRGIGPIQAARNEIGAAADVRDYASNWFRGSGKLHRAAQVQGCQDRRGSQGPARPLERGRDGREQPDRHPRDRWRHRLRPHCPAPPRTRSGSRSASSP